MQRLADLTGVPVERSARSDSTAVGAALLGGLRMGVWDGIGALPPWAYDLRAEPGLPEARRRSARDRYAEVLELTVRLAPPPIARLGSAEGAGARRFV